MLPFHALLLKKSHVLQPYLVLLFSLLSVPFGLFGHRALSEVPVDVCLELVEESDGQVHPGNAEAVLVQDMDLGLALEQHVILEPNLILVEHIQLALELALLPQDVDVFDSAPNVTNLALEGTRNGLNLLSRKHTHLVVLLLGEVLSDVRELVLLDLLLKHLLHLLEPTELFHLLFFVFSLLVGV